MSDDLLDEATRLADGKPQVRDDVRILRALVERVQQAEAERDDKARDGRLRLAAAERERDEALSRIDKALRVVELEVIKTRPLGSAERQPWFKVCNILNGKKKEDA